MSASADAAPKKPNIVVILADDMGFSDLGCYGGEIATPNLDSLAAHGLRYTQFYNTARCWPTRAAWLTGYYAQQVRFDTIPGMPKADSRERPKWSRLLPEYLKELGYRNYHSGKWHVDKTPFTSGFDHAYTCLDYDHNFQPRNQTLDDGPVPPATSPDRAYSTNAITDHAIDFLKEHQAKHAAEPFFSYVAYVVPHFPLQAPAEDIARCKGRYNIGWDAVRAARYQRIEEMLHLPGPLSPLESKVGSPYRNELAVKQFGDKEVWNETPWSELTDAQRDWQARKMEVHAAMVERMDREIGRIIDQVKAMNALDDTLILFFSDNGASSELLIRGGGHDAAAEFGSEKSFICLGPGWSNASNTPFRRNKTWVHEGGIATPLIAHWPAGIAARGELRSAVGHVIDLAPTILTLAGGTWPPQSDAPVPPPGKDLSPTFAADKPIDRDFLWWFHSGNRAIRQGDWKLVSAKNDPWELFDLAHDRAETHNLATDKPDKVEELKTLWEDELESFKKLAQNK
ncbi:MAG: arylsulfatase [Pirellulales bacterium]